MYIRQPTAIFSFFLFISIVWSCLRHRRKRWQPISHMHAKHMSLLFVSFFIIIIIVFNFIIHIFYRIAKICMFFKGEEKIFNSIVKSSPNLEVRCLFLFYILFVRSRQFMQNTYKKNDTCMDYPFFSHSNFLLLEDFVDIRKKSKNAIFACRMSTWNHNKNK